MLRAFAHEPYRPFFPLAALAGVVLPLLWILSLTGRPPGWAPALHGLLFVYGLLGSAVMGFLLTAYPRQNQAPPTGWGLVGPLLAGQVAFLGLGAAGQLQPALWLGALIWTGLLAVTLRIAVPSLRRTWEPTTAGVPLAVGALAGALIVAALTPSRLSVMLDLSVHGGLIPLGLLLLDRLLPFFSSKRLPAYDGRRQLGFLALLAVGVLLRQLLRGTGGVALAVADLFLLIVILRQWLGWRPVQGGRLALIAILHVSVAWMVVGYGVEAVIAITGVAQSALHLFTIGGLSTLVVGIAVRVTRGHAGRPLALGVDGIVLASFVQLAVLLRGVAPLVGLGALTPALHGAAGALAIAFGIWLVRLGPLVRVQPEG